MTDQEIYQLVVSVLEMAQSREETHLLHAKLLHRRIDALERTISLQGALAEIPACEERALLQRQLADLIAQDEIPGETRRLIARIETQHELAEALLSSLRGRLETD